MPRRDAETMGWVAEAAARVRLGRRRGLGPLAAARFLEPALREAVSMAGAGPEDNVVLLGAADLRPVAWIAPACRQLIVVDDLPDADLAGLEAAQRAAGFSNVSCQWGRPEQIGTPQYTTDRLIAINSLFRCREPLVAAQQMVFTSRHGSTIVCCEPSAALDARTARKYSREAELPMDEHRALVAYARAAAAHRTFTREGLAGLLSKAGIQEVEVREPLHGLVVAARGTVRF